MSPRWSFSRHPRRRATAERVVTDVFDLKTLGLIGGVLILLGAATAVVQALRQRSDSGINTAMLETFRLRVHAWWVLCSVLAAAFIIGKVATVVMFGLIAFWALREFITLTPTRPGDHRTLFWVFFLLTPLQFVLVGMESYATYSIVIPVYGFLFIPARIAIAGDYKRFLERTAKIQAGLLICVYCLSYAPALLTLPLPRPPDDSSDPGANARLLFFFVFIVQLSDALQYAWAQIPSRHVIAPAINPSKTWEGLLGGTASVTLLGAASLVGHAVFLVDGCRHVGGDRRDGFCRRADALGHQARPRRRGLRHAGRRATAASWIASTRFASPPPCSSTSPATGWIR